MPTLYLMANKTGNRNRILEMRKFRIWFRLVHPSIRLSVSLCVCEQMVLERLRPQFFTDFHEILYWAQKCGRFVAYCL